MNYRNLDDRFNNDPVFHQVVMNLQMLIQKLQLTPSEVREAAVFACMRQELLDGPRPLSFSPSMEDLLARSGYKKEAH